jgi:hypothetical protein
MLRLLLEAGDLPAPEILVARLNATHSDGESWMNAKAAAAYLGSTVTALHKLTAARLIPFHQDGPGCKLWFKRSELDEWRVGGGSRSSL